VPKKAPKLAQALEVPEDLQQHLTNSSEPYLAMSDARGDIWLADATALLRAQKSQSIDLIVTDPPYAIGKADWDHFESLDIYAAWCDEWIAECARVLTPAGSAYICGYSEILAEIKVKSARRFEACKWLVWYYRNKANLGRDWGRSHESILHLRVRKDTRINTDSVRIPYNSHTTKYPDRVQAVTSQFAASGRRDNWQPHPLGAKPRDVFEIPVICNGTSEKYQHPTQKPEELIEKLILASSAPGQLVMDPFSGSGTVAAVASRLHRRFIVGDRAPEYVAMTRSRAKQQMALDPVSDETQLPLL
jgi:site-specific DNA-methyltransferase (adenine-specific)